MNTSPLKHAENLHKQAHEHPLVDDSSFPSLEAWVSHLIHQKAYEEAARLVTSQTVLDLGCNIGYGMSIMAQTATSVAGLDISPMSVKAASERLGLGVDIRCYDGTQSTFASHSFDVVTSFQVIEHISDYNAYLREIARVLKPDGMAIFTTPNGRVRLDPGMKPWNPFHVREFSHRELEQLLAGRFQEVVVHGLFGSDELSRIERNRYERANQAVRRGSAPWRQAIRGGLRITAPWLENRLAMRGQQPANAGHSLQASEAARYSTADLHYTTSNLDHALEFLVIARRPNPQF